MKKQGKVLKVFKDKETGKLYQKNDKYVADELRYDYIAKLGYLTKGELVKEKKNYKLEEEE